MEGILQTSISFIFLCIFSFHTESIELYAVSLLSSVMMFILFFVVSTGKNRTVCRLRSSSSVPQPALLSARQQGRDLSMLKWAHVFPQFASSLIGKSVVQGWLNEWWRQYLTHSSLYFFLFFFSSWQSVQSDPKIAKAVTIFLTSHFLRMSKLSVLNDITVSWRCDNMFSHLFMFINLFLLYVRYFEERRGDEIFSRVCLVDVATVWRPCAEFSVWYEAAAFSILYSQPALFLHF